MMPMGSDLGDSNKNLEGRKSLALTARANMCGSIGVTGNPSSAKVLPEIQARQTACPGAPSLSYALADCPWPRARSAIK